MRSGALVRISPELVLTRELVERAETIVREAGADGITVSALRERLGTSRKYAVPLAEHLDRTGVTQAFGRPPVRARGHERFGQVPRSAELNQQRHLDGRPERQLRDADRGAGVPTLVAEDLDQQIARAVRDRRLLA